jgi:Domain of unknown function (DUF5134)
MTPAWILDILAALMLMVAAVSTARIAAARPWRSDAGVADIDVAHLLMAIAMAGMLAPGLGTLPDTAWEVIFGLLAAWFAVRVALDARASGGRALAGGHCAPHLVHSCSMLYMFLAVTVPAAGTSHGGMGGMSGTSDPVMTLRYPTLAFVFALILAGYSVWDLDQLSGRRYGPGATRVSLAGPGPITIPAMTVAEFGSAGLPGSHSAQVSPDVSDRPDAADRESVSCGGGAGGRVAAGAGGLLLAPSVTVGCRIAMGVVMAFMLVIAV